MSYRDLREWLDKVEGIGELIHIRGAHWNQEACMASSLTKKLVLFDDFPGYPGGFRMLSSIVKESLPRFFITRNWSTEARGVPLIKAWLERMRDFKPVTSLLVKEGPIRENIQRGEDINVLKFPVPFRNKGDGGRFIGTGHTVIMRDPDSGRINLGTYRMQVHDEKTLGLYVSEGKDGHIIMGKYHSRGQPCPLIAVVGVDPGIYLSSIIHLTHGDLFSELDFAGWLKGQPEEVIQGEYTGLPIPVRSEIALEGIVPPGQTKLEGPFREWMGYSQVREAPIVDVKTVYHRNNPILTYASGDEVHAPGKAGLRFNINDSALIWDQMEKAGVRGIKGVACYTHRLTVVSIRNLYAGHSRQAALIASQCHAGAYGGAYVIVVDEDIDPTNVTDVVWAVMMRTEPKRAIQLLDYCWSSQLTLQDPSYVQKADYAMRPEKATYSTRAIIDACKPLEWDPSWHQDVYLDTELKKEVLEKWGHLLGNDEA